MTTDWYSSSITFDENATELLNEFRAYLLNNDVKSARKLMKTYDIFNQLDSRRLNKIFNIPGFKFTKRDNQLTLYKPITTNKHKDIIPTTELEELHPTTTSSYESIPAEETKQDCLQAQQSCNMNEELLQQLHEQINSFMQSVQLKFNEFGDSHNHIVHYINEHENKINCIENIINNCNIQSIPRKISPLTINNEPIHKGEDAMNYVKMLHRPKEYQEEKPLSAYATFEPVQRIKRPKNTTEAFYKQKQKEREEQLNSLQTTHYTNL